jgi:signal transduction histidine kinase
MSIEQVQQLGVLYFCIISVNLMISALMWRGMRTRLHRDLALFWVSFLIWILIMAAGSPSPSYVLRVVTFMAGFPTTLLLARILATLCGIRLPYRSFGAAFGLAIPLTAVLWMLRAPSYVLAFPACVAVALPALYAGSVALGARRGQVSATLLGFAVTLIVMGLHCLDYAFAYAHPATTVVGVLAGLVIFFAISAFAPAAILEVVNHEKSRLELEMRYREAMAQSAKMVALGEFASGIAHEINTPLTVILFHAARLARTLKEDPANVSLLVEGSSKIEGMATRIAKVIRGLRSFSRDAEKDPFESVSVRTVIQDTMQLCADRLRREGVRIEESYEPEDLKIECRPTQLSQVILNLVNNALDELQSRPEKWIRFEARSLDSDAEITLTDSGPGIPAAVRDKMFQPFFTTKEIGKGTGLGLSISKGLVESHHGSLRLDPDSQRTRFVIRVPKRQLATASPP